ncbi:hypothetical protein BHE74_00019731 [Ensete ventricosum]|nr:hypothetical protein BHE74_00019731 [Ensete ventricosum]
MKLHVLSYLRIEGKELRSRGGGGTSRQGRVATSANRSHHGSDPSPRDATHKHLLFFAGDGNRKEWAKGTRSAEEAPLSVRKLEAEEVARTRPSFLGSGLWEVGFSLRLRVRTVRTRTSGSHSGVPVVIESCKKALVRVACVDVAPSTVKLTIEVWKLKVGVVKSLESLEGVFRITPPYYGLQ